MITPRRRCFPQPASIAASGTRVGATAGPARVRRAQRGFSLLEVLIALAVLALALFALSRTAAVAVSSTAHREETLLASGVAANVLAELRLEGNGPAAGRREGQARQGRRDFYWRANIVDTDLPGVMRIEIDVALDAQRRDQRVRLSGFAGRM